MNNGNMAAIMPNQNAPSAMGYVDPAAVAAAEAVKARIQSAYIMAMQKPRSYDQARIKILDACQRPSFAEKVRYSKPVGGSRIVGPSIRFAELALREWGNILYENQVVYDDEMTRRIQVTIIDLETNATFGAAVQISKTVERKNNKDREVISERVNSRGEKVYVVRATDDEIINKQSAMISKTLRNEGLRLIPQEIIEEAIEVSQETMQSQDAKDPDAARKKVVGAFNALGVQPKDLEQYLRHPLGQCVPAELQELRSIYSSIRDGEAKWIDYVKPKDDAENGNGNSEAARRAKEKIEALKKGMDASPKDSELDETQSRLLDILGSGGLDLTAAEQADYVKNHTGKKIGELSADESEKLIAAIDAEIKSRYME
jgi:hypothetical protein